MSSIGMCALFYAAITPKPAAAAASNEETSSTATSSNESTTKSIPIVKKIQRSISASPYGSPYTPNARDVISRYLFGYHYKTKRSLAEEAECGDEVSVCSWIKDGVDPDETDAYGYTPLLNAAALGRLNAVCELVKSGANVNKSGPFGFTPLHAAAQNGHREVVAELLKNGANINAQNDDMDTPMHLALRAIHIEIVHMLLRNGGNSKIAGFMNKDCVQCAKDFGLADLAKALKYYDNYSIGTHTFSAPNFGVSH